MVQRRAARFATSTYSREPGTVTNIIRTLEWQTLESNWKSSRLSMFCKATHGQVAVNIPSVVRRPSNSTRQYNPEKLTQISTSTDAFKYSYIPRTITDWNSLLLEAFQATSLECFKEHLRRLQLETCFYPILIAFVNTEHAGDVCTAVSALWISPADQ
ncbi:unnamed protein product [Mytilus coruscus]|uniref:Uncharacterized protein n=1 Tax=Mytilus coruscus TaxID=42192 RepID=A0A6J8EBK8_MYTCO|nr:unnamed protein product [Mytilus coruscus]